MVVGSVVNRHFRGFVCIDVKVAVAYDDTLVGELAFGTVGSRIAELVQNNGRIDEIVFAVEFTH